MRTVAHLPELAGPVVLVPVKAFRRAKARLAPSLDPGQRAELARRMAERVLAAASPLPVAVVCDDDEVGRWAAEHGAVVLFERGRGLNGAVGSGVRRLGEAGAGEVLVVHGDLPLAEGLGRLSGFAGVTLVPDRRDDGTNVVCLSPWSGFRFCYGPGSFHRHLEETGRLGIPVRVVRDPALGADVDVPDDIPPSMAFWGRP